MIPKIYPKNTILHIGVAPLGYLPDCISCTVTEERNGIFELELIYPVTGVNFDMLQIGRMIAATYAYTELEQLFYIYRRTAELSGTVTINAFHWSYLLTNSIMAPATYTSLADTLDAFRDDPMTGASGYLFQSDMTSTSDFTITVPSSIKSLMVGQKGSLVDVYGGEFYFLPNGIVRLVQSRGENNGVTIRYGKNLTELKDTLEASDLFSSAIPYWQDSEGNVVYGTVINGLEPSYWTEEGGEIITDENFTNIELYSSINKCVALDLSNEFEEAPSASQLRVAAMNYMINNQTWVPNRNLEVDFVALWQTTEYEDFSALESVNLCDTVKIIYTELGVNATAKVIKTEYDSLMDRYTKIELGKAIDQTRGYTGKMTIGGKVYKIINGLITEVLNGDT